MNPAFGFCFQMLLRELLSFPLYFIFHVFDLPLSVLRELRLEVYGSPHSINWTLGLAAGSLQIWGLSGSKVKVVPSPLASVPPPED